MNLSDLVLAAAGGYGSAEEQPERLPSLTAMAFLGYGSSHKAINLAHKLGEGR